MQLKRGAAIARLRPGVFRATIGLLLTLPSVAASQTEPRVLRGRVLDALTGDPIRAAVVQVGGAPQRVLTDAAGRFVFARVTSYPASAFVQALGYEDATQAVEPGSGAEPIIRMQPKPVPLAAVEALARPKQRTTPGGMRVRVFGLDQLLAFDDASAAAFVREKAHLPTVPCSSIASYDSPRQSLGRYGEVAPPELLMGEDCLVGHAFARVEGRMVYRTWAVPVIVYVDGIRQYYPWSELNAHRAWDLARVEVFSSGTPAAAVVRIQTKGYVERTAARLSHLCDDLARLDGVAADSARSIRSLCAP